MALEENLDVVFRDPRLRVPQTPEKCLTFQELTAILDKVELTEVAFEGQEASLDPALPDICRWFKQKNCKVVLHTNGVCIVNTPNIDDVVLSIKAVTPELYKEYAGISNEIVLQNFEHYYKSGVNLKAESVFIPGYIDLIETEKIAQFIASVDPKIPYRIDAYFTSGKNPWRAPTIEEMGRAVSIARQHLANVYSTQQTKKDLTKSDLMYEVIRLF
ncbi:MAG: radical SAM protein [Dehalogenimonas sp.]